ncbi:MAG: hypothetical protein ACSHXF_15225 [Aquaticitalea sp.]
MRKLKLIWDFRGPDGHKIAEHHAIHLKEYIAINSINSYKTGVEIINEMHSIAFMAIDESDMKPIRDALKPHRGQVYEE